MLRLLVTRMDGVETVESLKGVNSVVVFVDNSAGHPKPFVQVKGAGEMRFPQTCHEQARDFYDDLDEREKAMYDAMMKAINKSGDDAA